MPLHDNDRAIHVVVSVSGMRKRSRKEILGDDGTDPVRTKARGFEIHVSMTVELVVDGYVTVVRVRFKGLMEKNGF